MASHAQSQAEDYTYGGFIIDHEDTRHLIAFRGFSANHRRQDNGPESEVRMSCRSAASPLLFRLCGRLVSGVFPRPGDRRSVFDTWDRICEPYGWPRRSALVGRHG